MAKKKFLQNGLDIAGDRVATNLSTPSRGSEI